MRRRGGGPSGDPPDPSLPVGTDTLPQIRHIVVLMMENHSYDNYLGMLTGRGEGLELDSEGNPIATNPTKDGLTVRAQHRGEKTQVKGLPVQSWRDSHLQWNEGNNDGFARSVQDWKPDAHPGLALSYWSEADLPFYYGLARTFPLATKWFSSCLGPTFPNRRFLIAGTAHGLIDDLPFGLFDYPIGGTIFDVLTANDISWSNYRHTPNVRVIFTRLLGKPGLRTFRRIGLVLSRLFPPLAEAVLGNLQFTADLYPLGALGSFNHLRSIDKFWGDAASGRLPQLSIVDPDFSHCSEESPQDIQIGEGFAARVINAVMRGKAWPHTLLVWLYDEHGGYFDHVPPPEAIPPDDARGHSLLEWRGVIAWLLRRFGLWKRLEQIDRGPTAYDRYGFRVPAVIVSPYARPDFVTDRVYDHASILKLIERKWNLPPLTRRDEAATDPLESLDLTSPPAFLTPPVLPPPAKAWKDASGR